MKWKKVSPYFGLAGNNSYIASRPVKSLGINLGISTKSRHKFYLGVVGLRKTQEYNEDDRSSVIKRKKQLQYFNIGAEFPYKKFWRFHLYIPTQLGFGKALRYKETNNVLDYNQKVSAIVLASGINSNLFIKKWFFLRFETGYRIVVGQKVTASYSSPYYVFGAGIKIKELKKYF